MDTPTAAQRLSHFSQRPPPPPPLPLCQLAPPSARLGPDKTAMDLPAAAAPSLAPPSRRASRRPPRRRTATEEGTGDDAPWLRVTCKMTRGGGPFFLPFFFFFGFKQNFRSRPFPQRVICIVSQLCVFIAAPSPSSYVDLRIGLGVVVANKCQKSKSCSNRLPWLFRTRINPPNIPSFPLNQSPPTAIFSQRVSFVRRRNQTRARM